ncbi:putative inactive cadmium/zinc-transporting ATPase HMA3 isoform X1 [Quercus robur]|nr:putative inactive cadmium/zinc-transporting ATPase HMA3 isoform X1 [Quercus robur]XP_050260496.1 putative inactive cadmium/zinc-transporting ATPase HMA3 isoform X1 [Quercus robur]XP_050260497.1 putative inactive cadmium/zinc-transporting ATPase HMA3 isoform X1 [Quercus robur]
MGSQERIKTVKSLQRSYFDVLGLCCSSEVPLIENILKPLEGVKEVSVIVTTRTVIVVHDNLLISQIQIVKALNQARLEANVRVYGEENYKKKWPSPFAIACGLLLSLSFLKYVYHPLQWLAVGAVAIGIIPITLKVMVSIRNLRIDINILMMIAVIGTLAMNDYLEAGTIVFLFIIAEWLESRAGHKAHAVMSSLMNMAPQKAVMAETGEVVDADEVKLNAVLAIKAGEVIPIDGVVVEGQCEVDEKALTGESFPVAKEKDSTVWAGTINLNGYVCVKTTALAEDCVVAKMAKLVEEAQKSKTATQRLIDKCAKFYTPAVLIISAGFAVIPLALKVHNLNHWFHLALVVLVSACPCALILSTPVATFCALTKAATSGLLIKGGDYLETLAKIKVAAFDKTGTITKGEFVVTDFRSLRDDISLNTLIYWVSSIESKSSHPMAAALVDHARSLKIEPKPENVGEFQNFPGEGIHGNIDGHDIYIGNRKIALRAGCRTVPALEGDKLEGKTIGYIYCGATPAGIFSLSDACRIGVLDAIRELKLMGIETAMLTGDSHAAATHAQEQLDHALEIVRAELLPEDKARTIGEFKKKGPTAMIGDGVNDAPALATADIGISMGISGSALATETGQVILMSNDLRKIPEAIQLAKKAHRKVIVNILLSITTKSAILALAFAGHPLVWAAVLADVGTCLLVILNSMLLLRGTQKHRGTCNKSSTAKHTHKNGCNATHSSSSHHHHSQEKHHNCCSDNKAQIVSQPQKCSSMECAAKCKSIRLNSNSCGTNNCMDSAASHDKCVSSEHHEANHCLELHEGQNECRSVPQNLGSCTKEECKNLIESQGDCVKGDRFHVAQHCNHSTPSEGRQNITNDGHCHSNHSRKNHTDNEASGKTVVSCCHHPQQMQEIHHELHECCKNHNAPLQTTVDIDYVESTSTNAMEKRETDDCCKGHRKHLERQNIPNDGHCHSNHCGKNHTDNGASGKMAVSSCHHQQPEIHPNLHECCKDKNAPLHTTIGGCCKSYMEECCGKHGHIAANFGGGLSEIVTES